MKKSIAESPSASRKPAPAQAKQEVATATTKAAPAANPANNALRAEARAIYAGRCVPCHGASGRGDGPAGAALNPHPRNFTDKTWQLSVSAAHIEKIIVNGGPAVGKSPLMPAQADLAKNPALLRALANYIQELGH